jgi:hypothetical protein
MALQVLFDGSGNIMFDCGGNVVFCDPTAETWLCCRNCNIDADTAYYSFTVPCGGLVATFSSVSNDSCNECAGFNIGWELPQTQCNNWQDTWSDPLDPCVGVTAFNFSIRVQVDVCCNSSTNKIELWVWCLVSFQGTSAAWFSKKLDEQDFANGGCYHYDFSDPSTIGALTYIGSGDPITTCDGDAIYGRSDCFWAVSSLTLAAA